MQNINIETIKSELIISERKRLDLQRRKNLEGTDTEDLNLWPMLDLMTLILVFFIILYADLLPTTVPESVEALLKPVLQTEKTPVKTEKMKTKKINPRNNELLAIKNDLHKALSGVDLSGYSVEMRRNRIVISINEKISFPVGRADLLEEIKEPLKNISNFINRSYVYRVIVSGHTDTTPIHTQKFPSNWELSVARAMSVAKFLMAQDVDPTGISVEGFGQYDPVADNESREGRQANRRVEITLLNEAI